MTSPRSALSRSSRIVVKIGSRVLAQDPDLVRKVTAEVAGLKGKNRSFVIVSSGAIALGVERLGYRKRPREMPQLQAAAAVGQTVLMHRYADHFSAHGIASAQVLLTHADLRDRERLNNARGALLALLDAGAVPVINENDTVATDEIRFGDNDQLSAMVVPLVSADLLLLLTDVDGILDRHGKRISTMTHTSEIGSMASKNALGSGGIESKIEAARRATRSGATAVVASALCDNIIERVVAGEDLGTLFEPHASKLRARKHWIAYTLRPSGVVVIDAGAAEALRGGHTSLLPIGVIGIRGTFNAGDSVRLLNIDGSEVGRGLTRMGALEAARAAGKSTAELKPLLPHHGARPVVVHKDDLVVTE